MRATESSSAGSRIRACASLSATRSLCRRAVWTASCFRCCHSMRRKRQRCAAGSPPRAQAGTSKTRRAQPPRQRTRLPLEQHAAICVCPPLSCCAARAPAGGRRRSR
eukprot:2555760-Pleurochrysis_carterae.AAC.1